MLITTDMKRRQEGAAGIEALLVVVFLVVPMWWLLVNMAYSGVRSAKAQEATRIAGYDVLARITKGQSVGDKVGTIAKNASDQAFPSEDSTVVSLQITEDAGSIDISDELPGVLQYTGSLLSSISSHRKVEVEVERVSPNQMFPDSEIEVSLVMVGTPLTYCESMDKSFDVLSAENIAMGAFEFFSIAGDVALALFGGWPGGDNCP